MRWFKSILLWLLVKLGLVKVERQVNWYPVLKRAARNGHRWSKTRTGRNVDIRVKLKSMESPDRHRTAWSALRHNKPNA